MRQSLILFLFVALFMPSFAQEEFINNNCPNTTGDYYINDVVLRYEVDSRRLVMVNLLDGSIVRLIEENVDILNFGVFSWSPNCRYLIALLENNLDGDDFLPAALWDIEAGTRLLSFNTYEMRLPFSYGLQVLWKPDSSQAVLSTDIFWENHLFLWNSADNSLLTLEDNPSSDMLAAYWDEGRNQLYLSAYPCVVAYNLSTGERLSCYASNSLRGVTSTFYVSPDKSRIIVFTNAAPRLSQGEPAYLTIWHLDTGESLEINLAGFSANAQQVAISPDNRYLVLANRSLLRVWDIQNLPENFEDRQAVYTHGGPEGLISRVYFVDGETIETISEDGTQRWNIHTGVYVANS